MRPRRRLAAHPQLVADAEARLAHRERGRRAGQAGAQGHQDAPRTGKGSPVYQARLSKFKRPTLRRQDQQGIPGDAARDRDRQSDLGVVEERVIERMSKRRAGGRREEGPSRCSRRSRRKSTRKRKCSGGDRHVEAGAEGTSDKRAGVIASMHHSWSRSSSRSRAREGLAIAAATRDGLCSACHVRMRPQVFQEVRRNDQIIQCFSCNRTLLIPAPHRSNPPRPTLLESAVALRRRRQVRARERRRRLARQSGPGRLPGPHRTGRRHDRRAEGINRRRHQQRREYSGLSPRSRGQWPPASRRFTSSLIRTCSSSRMRGEYG